MTILLCMIYDHNLFILFVVLWTNSMHSDPEIKQNDERMNIQNTCTVCCSSVWCICICMVSCGKRYVDQIVDTAESTWHRSTIHTYETQSVWLYRWCLTLPLIQIVNVWLIMSTAHHFYFLHFLREACAYQKKKKFIRNATFSLSQYSSCQRIARTRRNHHENHTIMFDMVFLCSKSYQNWTELNTKINI